MKRAPATLSFVRKSASTAEMHTTRRYNDRRRENLLTLSFVRQPDGPAEMNTPLQYTDREINSEDCISARDPVTRFVL